MSGAWSEHVEAAALIGRPLRYFDYVMAAFVTILLLSNVLGAGKVAVVTVQGIGPWPFGAGIAVDLRQHVADHIGDGEEEDAGAERPGADDGQGDDGPLLRADHVREQQHHDERDHDEIEVAEARAVKRSRFDMSQARPVHGA